MFNGLPGLIIQINDTEQIFDFQVINIINNKEENLYIPKKGKKVSLEIFNKNWTFPNYTIQNYQYITEPDGVTQYDVGYLIPIVSLGKFYDEPNGEAYYGLRMRNKDGYITLRTESQGNLWLANSAINILTYGTLPTNSICL